MPIVRAIGVTLAAVLLLQVGLALTIALFGNGHLQLTLAQLLFLVAPATLLLRRVAAEGPAPSVVARGWLPYLAALLGTIGLAQLAQVYLLLQLLVAEAVGLGPEYRAAQRQSDTLLAPLLHGNGWLGMGSVYLAVALVPAVGEELLFRGYALGSLRRHLPPMGAIAGTALLFGMSHLQPVTLVPLTALGWWFGWLVMRSGGILPAMLGHALFNGMTIAVVQISPGALEPSREVGGGDLAAALPFAVIGGGLLVAALRLLRRVRIISYNDTHPYAAPSREEASSRDE